jgi:hypothetical protein
MITAQFQQGQVGGGCDGHESVADRTTFTSNSTKATLGPNALRARAPAGVRPKNRSSIIDTNAPPFSTPFSLFTNYDMFT